MALPQKLSLRWHTTVLGWLFIVGAAATVVFAVAAVDPFAIEFSEYGRREKGVRQLLKLGQSGHLNWVAAAIAVYMAAWALIMGWRWADEVAIRADDDGLVFHRSTRRKALSWSEVRAVTYAPFRRTGALTVQTTAGDKFTLKQVDPAKGPEFVRAVTARWLALPPPADGM